jgi:DNA-nicking Smr family endonuclease
MKSELSSKGFKPFEELQTLLEQAEMKAEKAVPSVVPQMVKDHHPEGSRKSERQLFLEAMADVQPMSGESVVAAGIREKFSTQIEAEELDALQALDALIKKGQGFNVADTSEYVEGTGYNVNPEIARRLHAGDFSIQAHVDLHGMSVAQARDALNHFLKDVMMSGKRAVLIVHGRGLGSRRDPVLKGKVIEWLTGSCWRKWVMAFSSARLCDGGAGGTYVLLRERPFTRRYRKLKKRQGCC